MNAALANPFPVENGRLGGTVRVPASKSITHRLYILAALSRRPLTVSGPLRSEDTDLTLAALQSLGYHIEQHEHAARFSGDYRRPLKPAALWLGNSGTGVRLLSAVAAVHNGMTQIDGTSRMRQRPMAELLTALGDLGIVIEHTAGHLPLTIHGRTPQGGLVHIDAGKSSQFLSALLLIAPLTRDGLRIDAGQQIASRDYVDMTTALMGRARVAVNEPSPGCFVVIGGGDYALPDSTVEGDYSAASYWLAGAAISGGEVFIPNLSTESLQGDRVIVDILSAAGAQIQREAGGLRIRGAQLHGIDRDMQRCPDLAPAVAVAALFADGPSRLRNLAHLRYKESDRMAAIIGNIRLLGGSATAENGDLVIEPRPLHGATLPTFDDHRIAMAFALGGLRIEGIHIENPGCVGKSYPQFWSDLAMLQGR